MRPPIVWDRSVEQTLQALAAAPGPLDFAALHAAVACSDKTLRGVLRELMAGGQVERKFAWVRHPYTNTPYGRMDLRTAFYSLVVQSKPKPKPARNRR